MARWNGLVRRAFKEGVAGVVHHTGLQRAMCAVRRAQSGGRRITIVSYHRVVGDYTGALQCSIPGLLISLETFERHLLEAWSAGYELASLDHALDVMAGRRSAKRDLFVVTFDDGYRDVVRYAAPILKRMGVPATIYLPVGFIGTQRRFNHDRLFHLLRVASSRGVRPVYDGLPASGAALLAPVLSGTKPISVALDDFIAEHPTAALTELIDALEKQLGGGPELTPDQGDVLDWDEAKALAAQGFTLGAHTIGHTVLTLEPEARVNEELRVSKEEIERHTGQRVDHFAYCNGWYSDELIAALVRNGFKSAVTTEDLPNRVGGDPFTLKRKVLWENFSVGASGEYSSALTSCQLDDVFGFLGLTRPVLGKRTQCLA
jgi:peptidoglycan/xylan/chitin deacetylase (PgdA/CDA1 family)